MSQGQTFQYDPIQVVFNVGGKDVSGYAEGTFVEVERAVDAFTTTSGSDGEVTRTKSQNRIGTFKVTLQQSSPSNDVFSALATLDEQSSGGAVPILLSDRNGTTIAQCKQGWVKKKANTTFANTSENREWTFETGNLVYDVGGENLL